LLLQSIAFRRATRIVRIFSANRGFSIVSKRIPISPNETSSGRGSMPERRAPARCRILSNDPAKPEVDIQLD